MKLLEGYDLLLVILGLAILAASTLPRLFAHRPASLPMAPISAPVIGYSTGGGSRQKPERSTRGRGGAGHRVI